MLVLRRVAVLAVLSVAFAMVLFSGSAAAAGAWWRLDSLAAPANLAPGAAGSLVVSASNLGEGEVNAPGEAVRLRDVLPAGLVATGAMGKVASVLSIVGGRGPVPCSVLSGGTVIECTYAGNPPGFGPEGLAPYETIEVAIAVKVLAGAHSGEENELVLSGGHTPPATLHRAILVAGGPTPFGVANFEVAAFNEDGSLATQAGSHPFALTTTIDFNRTSSLPFIPGLVKTTSTRLPAGLVGNPSALPQCSDAQFQRAAVAWINQCPNNTAVGVASVTIVEPLNFTPVPLTLPVPLFNLKPSVGEPARFGFDVISTHVTLDVAVRSGSDYGVTVNSNNTTQFVSLLSAQITVWGVPGDPVHDQSRGWGCVAGEVWKIADGLPCSPVGETAPPAFLSLPSACSGPLQSTLAVDSWAHPGSFLPSLSSPMRQMDGCNKLPFEPSVKVTPDGSAASTPTGLNVDVHIPQGATLNAHGLAEAQPRNITVALPEGVAVDPSGGDGLLACSQQLIGFTGFGEFSGARTATFTPSLPEPLAPGVNFCPDSSKIGTVTIRTPILPHPIEGAVYLAAQNQNPFGSLIAMYIVAEDPVSGVLIRLAGQVHLSASGQVVATFENSPQAPFEDAELDFFGGERAPLTSPAHCGSYTTVASLTPWSAEPEEAPRTATSTFNVSSGPHGSPCPGASLPFSPSLTAGTTNINAGSFSALSTTIGREDGQQDMQSVTLHFPPGLSGLLSSVKLCPEQQANEGTCGPESLIGETTVAAGVGADPVTVKGGKVYITEKYAGAPFGLSIVNPVKAGPFDLEHDTANPAQNPACDCVVVRATINIDPTTAALTVTTDPSGPHAIPRLIDGIPVQIQKVNVLVNRPGFTFNPTNCNPMSITGSIGSVEGASSPVSVPLQVTNCAVLKFTPGFSVATSGKASKANGASLSVKLSYPGVPFGSEANIASVKVELPKQLPSRLTTLQKACTAAQFDANPAGCPAASVVGHAIVHTPLLPVPIEGPAYFVSNGGEAFPNLIMVLQGYGVTVKLVGDTFINKQGITSSTFKATPDVPFSTFELDLPQGPHSALAANVDLCAASTKTKTVSKRVILRRRGHTLHLLRRVKQLIPEALSMPTTIVAQNGARIEQNTKISVTGCSKARPKTRHKPTHHKTRQKQGGR